MIIEKTSIKKFRGFEDVEFSLGSHLTIIAGQNGTQKTTILGMLSQTFGITATDNPMWGEKPLTGDSFRSAFGEKFKLSSTFDKPKTHEWTLFLKNEEKPFVIESIPRHKDGIRFWRKGERGKGSGYIQLPVIYLSLKRLMPIGEDDQLNVSSIIKLSNDEEKMYKDLHNEILISLDNLIGSNYLESPTKSTLGIDTDYYDWKQNSAGQDNIGKIILAILSFKRLKEKYQSGYKGGILAIDELDATLYPASQVELLRVLNKYSSKFNIQIIFTTHSLTILEEGCRLQAENSRPETKDHVKVIFLEKKNNKIKIIENVTYNTIKHRLNVSLSSGKTLSKIDVFTEDKETSIFVKALLKGRSSKLNFIDCALSCSSLIDLSNRKLPPFIFPNSIIFLDGDVKINKSDMSKIRKLKNVILLPSDLSPERLLANFLINLDDESEIWGKINSNFTRQYCFKGFKIEEILKDRKVAKTWFNTHLHLWGSNATKVINPWIVENKEEVDKFVQDYIDLYNTFAQELSIEKLYKK
jgi:predicted ATPase